MGDQGSTQLIRYESSLLEFGNMKIKTGEAAQINGSEKLDY